MRFQKVFIEITNICGLACSFCPTKNLPVKTMPLEFFEKICAQIKPYTKEIALHVMGDPLTLSNLREYLNIAQNFSLHVNITTSGYYLKNHPNLFHPALKQINISLNSFNKNESKMSFEEYMNPILELKQKRGDKETFINLRLWNLDKNNSEQEYNKKVFTHLEKFFHTTIPKQRSSKALRLDRKILLHFDSYFEWPSLKSEHFSQGFCHGLASQLAILADGRVVPCCLDADGILTLGSLHVNTLKEILQSQKARKIKEGFEKGICEEKLCQKCSYKDRFNALL